MHVRKQTFSKVGDLFPEHFSVDVVLSPAMKTSDINKLRLNMKKYYDRQYSLDCHGRSDVHGNNLQIPCNIRALTQSTIWDMGYGLQRLVGI